MLVQQAHHLQEKERIYPPFDFRHADMQRGGDVAQPMHGAGCRASAAQAEDACGIDKRRGPVQLVVQRVLLPQHEIAQHAQWRMIDQGVRCHLMQEAGRARDCLAQPGSKPI